MFKSKLDFRLSGRSLEKNQKANLQVNALPITLGGTGANTAAPGAYKPRNQSGGGYDNVISDSDGISAIENIGNLGIRLDATGADFGETGTGCRSDFYGFSNT